MFSPRKKIFLTTRVRSCLIRCDGVNTKIKEERQRQRKERSMNAVFQELKAFDTYEDTGDRDLNQKIMRIGMEARDRYGELGMRLLEVV